MRGEFVEQILCVNVEQHAVDRLKLNALVMDVDHLDQRVAREGVLALIVALLCGGKAVVAVADGKEQLVVLVGDQRFQRVLHLLDHVFGQEVAVDMTAVLHQLKAVCLLEAVLLFSQRLDDGELRVVDQQQDMRHLERSVLADLYARRDALKHGRLGRADRGGRALAVVVILQVDDADNAAAQGIVGLALDIDHAVLVGIEHITVKILLHIGVDIIDTCAVVIAQIDLGQDDVQCRGLVADDLLHIVPVFRLAGVLVTGDNRPFVKILLG